MIRQNRKSYKEQKDAALNFAVKFNSTARGSENSVLQRQASDIILECSPELIQELKKVLAPSIAFDGEMVQNILFLRLASLKNREQRAKSIKQILQTAYASFIMKPPERRYLMELITSGTSDTRNVYFEKEIALNELFLLYQDQMITLSEKKLMTEVIKQGRSEEGFSNNIDRKLLKQISQKAKAKTSLLKKIQLGILTSVGLTRTAFTRHSYLKYHGKSDSVVPLMSLIAEMIDRSFGDKKNDQ